MLAEADARIIPALVTVPVYMLAATQMTLDLQRPDGGISLYCRKQARNVVIVSGFMVNCP